MIGKGVDPQKAIKKKAIMGNIFLRGDITGYGQFQGVFMVILFRY